GAPGNGASHTSSGEPDITLGTLTTFGCRRQSGVYTLVPGSEVPAPRNSGTSELRNLGTIGTQSFTNVRYGCMFAKPGGPHEIPEIPRNPRVDRGGRAALDPRRGSPREVARAASGGVRAGRDIPDAVGCHG